MNETELLTAFYDDIRTDKSKTIRGLKGCLDRIKSMCGERQELDTILNLLPKKIRDCARDEIFNAGNGTYDVKSLFYIYFNWNNKHGEFWKRVHYYIKYTGRDVPIWEKEV